MSLFVTPPTPSAVTLPLGFDFVPITFYDGQGMMVRADSGITTLAELEGATDLCAVWYNHRKELCLTT